MRIDPDERRKLNRRLRSHIAPAILAGVRHIPKIALVVSTTFYLSSEAKADLESGKADSTLTMSIQAEDQVKTYTKEELQKTMPKNPSVTLQDRILSEMNGLLKDMSRSPTSKIGKESFTKNPTMRDYHEHLQSMKAAPKSRKANPDKLRAAFANEAQKGLTKKVKSKLSFLDTIKSGFKMNFDIKSLFSSNEKTVKKSKGKVRYGLILKDITPGKAPGQAAISNDMEQVRYAGHADVEWTIGPLDETQGRRLFSVPAVSPKNSAKYDLWDRIVPEGKFQFSARPDSINNLSTVRGGADLPPIMWSMKQNQDYWLLQYKTKTDGTKISALHTFKVPIYGSLKVGRRFDDNWNVISTSAYDILIDKRAPIVSVHYMNIEERFRGTLSHKIDSNSSVGLSAQGRATGIVSDEKHRPEKYSASYSKKF